METHRVLHDFGELSYEDVADIHSAVEERRSLKDQIRAQLYYSLLAAFCVGIIFGSLTRRN